MKILGNVVVFVILYLLLMLPTYLLPYLGSNSSVFGVMSMATNAGVNPATWLHLGALVALMLIAWFRGVLIGKKWLVIFPILAAVFDLMPGLSSIPMIPTVMHLLAVILGVIGVRKTSLPSSQ